MVGACLRGIWRGGHGCSSGRARGPGLHGPGPWDGPWAINHATGHGGPWAWATGPCGPRGP
eukprot:5024680-Alexandrium_andersonii.AAC.1